MKQKGLPRSGSVIRIKMKNHPLKSFEVVILTSGIPFKFSILNARALRDAFGVHEEKFLKKIKIFDIKAPNDFLDCICHNAENNEWFLCARHDNLQYADYYPVKVELIS